MKRLGLMIAAVAAFAVLANAACISYTVVTVDELGNVKQGLPNKDRKWADKLAKKYTATCYVNPSPAARLIFYVTVTPAVYHGTRSVHHQSSDPVSGTVTDQEGNTSTVSGTVSSSTSEEVPYSVDYGVFTLAVERIGKDGKYETIHRFRQKGLFSTMYGIPMGGKGHHPLHAVIEEATKWVNQGGPNDNLQGSIPTH